MQDRAPTGTVRPKPSHKGDARRRSRETQPTCLYRCFTATGELLYVGISLSVMARLGDHAHTKSWWLDVARIEVEHFAGRELAATAERLAIANERPRHNIVHQVDITQPPTLPAPGERWVTPELARTEFGCTDRDFVEFARLGMRWWVLAGKQCLRESEFLRYLEVVRP